MQQWEWFFNCNTKNYWHKKEKQFKNKKKDNIFVLEKSERILFALKKK